MTFYFPMEIPKNWPASPLKRENLRPEEIKEFLRIRADYEKSAFVTEGHFEVRATTAKEFSEPIPPEESPVTALVAHASGYLYGATSGTRAHLFFYNPAPDADACAEIGVVAPDCQIPALAVTGDGTVYGLGNRSGRMFLFRYLPSEVLLEQRDFTGMGVREVFDLPAEDQLFFSTIDPCHGAGKIELLDLVLPDETASALVADTRGMLWMLTDTTGTLLCWNPKDMPEPKTVGTIGSMGGHSNTLLPTGSGVVAATLYGRLMMGTENGLEPLGCQAPAIKGRELYNRVTAWNCHAMDEGLYYGGTIDGILFALDLAKKETICLGKPTDQPRITALAASAGMIYGLNGTPEDCAHFFCYNPQNREQRDLGCILARSERPWNGYRCESMVRGKDGTLFLGENDRLGHLFRYFPPAR
ncbi:MAG: hypothetical protein J6Y80_01765 [Victivallales bacterium]|nr:hypothetical protein [Victivallales bacterium]